MSRNSSQPSRHYKIEAIPAKGQRAGFVGQYTFPGRDIQQARAETGSVEVFDTEDEAMAAAGEDLCKALNGRTRGTNKHNYKRMGGSELAVALADLNITPAEFAILYGTLHRRVMDWLDGNEDIPHPVRILLSLFTQPSALHLARQVTSMVTSRKENEDGKEAAAALDEPATAGK